MDDQVKRDALLVALRAAGLDRFDGCGTWELSEEPMSGAWYWERAGACSMVLYATPWWEGDAGVWFQIIDDDGNILLLQQTGPLDYLAHGPSAAARAYYDEVRVFLRNMQRIGAWVR